jgi:hypothetical protein
MQPHLVNHKARQLAVLLQAPQDIAQGTAHTTPNCSQQSTDNTLCAQHGIMLAPMVTADRECACTHVAVQPSSVAAYTLCPLMLNTHDQLMCCNQATHKCIVLYCMGTVKPFCAYLLFTSCSGVTYSSLTVGVGCSSSHQ